MLIETTIGQLFLKKELKEKLSNWPYKSLINSVIKSPRWKQWTPIKLHKLTK